MPLITKDKTRDFYFRHFDKDDTDFDHMYEVITMVEKDISDCVKFKKEDLRKYGHHFAKAPVQEMRMEWAEDNLIELTPKQTEFISIMGIVIISRAMKVLGIVPFNENEE